MSPYERIIILNLALVGCRAYFKHLSAPDAAVMQHDLLEMDVAQTATKLSKCVDILDAI